MGLSSDPAKARQWQERSRQRAIAKMRERGVKLAPRERATTVKPGGLQGAQRDAQPRKRKNSDAPWRAACIERYGSWCRVCGDHEVQMDHMNPKGQGGARDDVRNGLPLCQPHHEQKTDGKLRIEWSWLDKDQLQYLAESGWVAWDDQGEPYGRGWKHFGRRKMAGGNSTNGK